MTVDPVMAAVRLMTAAVLIVNACVFTYGYLTLHPDTPFSKQWPMLVHTRRPIILGLAIEATGWAVHQSYWWVWQEAMALHQVAVARTLEAHSVWLIGAHGLVIVGGVMVVAPVARDLMGARWIEAVSVCVLGFGVLGYILAGGA